MAHNRNHFESFEPHTLLKHTVLRTYLETWAMKMLLRHGATSTICIVDACAGAGMDAQGNPGSPVLAAQVAKEAEEHLQARPDLRARFKGPVRIEIVAIEKEAKHHRTLVQNVEAFGDRVRAVHGTLAGYMDEHDSSHRGTPTLFFVDPFGLAPLQADVIQRGLRGPKNEVLLLFADQAALRHFGAATAPLPDVEAEIAASTPIQFGFFDDPDAQVQQAREEATARALAKSTALELTKPRAIAILNAAFGGEGWREIIEATPQPLRRAKFLELYIDLLHRFGATRVLPLPMRNHRDQHVYTLLHATQSVRGYTAMKSVVSSALRNAPLPTDAVESMLFQISTDLDTVEALVRRRFAGQTVPWVQQKDGRPSVSQYVLEDTPAFNFELAELKRRLKNEKVRGRGPEMYVFPPPARG